VLNGVKAVERGVDQLYNYIAELAALGLELAEVRRRDDERNARRDIDELQRIGVVGRERARRLQRLRELRRLLVHEYATATAEQVHEAARLVADEFVPFYDAYRGWIARGFKADERYRPPRKRTKTSPIWPPLRSPGASVAKLANTR
jgi:uncharacterized protein YutE (UPF0331/DUF86 family)